MYQEFSILTLETILPEKKIVVTTNNAIDPNSVVDEFLEIYERESKAHVSFDVTIEGESLIVELKKWPVPNSSYIFYLKSLKNVLGQDVKSGIKRRIEFKSCITSEVEILSPSMHEKVKELTIKTKTIVNSDIEAEYDESTKIQLSTDNAFYNISKETTTKEDEIALTKIKSGQYFMRARKEAMIDGQFQYGKWSDVVTFFYGNEVSADIELEEEPSYTPDYDDMTPIIEDELDDLEFEISCKNGQTPDKLFLIASKPIDEDSFDATQVTISGDTGYEKADIKLYENKITIDLEDGFRDNQTYTITLMNIKCEDGEEFSGTFTLVTRIRPLYSDLTSVKALIGDHKIADDVILIHIREASKYAKYIISHSEYPYEIDEDDIPFAVQQFVKYYAAHECLLRHTVDLSSSTGMSGTIGNVTFSEKETVKDITSLLKHFCSEIDKWKEALKGYELEGRARVRSGVRGKYASPEMQSLGLGKRGAYGRGNVYGGRF